MHDALLQANSGLGRDCSDTGHSLQLTGDEEQQVRRVQIFQVGDPRGVPGMGIVARGVFVTFLVPTSTNVDPSYESNDNC